MFREFCNSSIPQFVKLHTFSFSESIVASLAFYLFLENFASHEKAWFRLCWDWLHVKGIPSGGGVRVAQCILVNIHCYCHKLHLIYCQPHTVVYQHKTPTVKGTVSNKVHPFGDRQFSILYSVYNKFNTQLEDVTYKEHCLHYDKRWVGNRVSELPLPQLQVMQSALKLLNYWSGRVWGQSKLVLTRGRDDIY